MRKGFTLIELLVVVLIMRILAFVAMPQYYKSVEKSRSAEAINALNALAEAIERRIIQKGPSTTLGLIRHFDQPESEIDIGVVELSYFTFDVGRPEVAISGDNNVRLMLKRKDDAGGGLGKYTIQLTYFWGQVKGHGSVLRHRLDVRNLFLQERTVMNNICRAFFLCKFRANYI